MASLIPEVLRDMFGLAGASSDAENKQVAVPEKEQPKDKSQQRAPESSPHLLPKPIEGHYANKPTVDELLDTHMTSQYEVASGGVDVTYVAQPAKVVEEIRPLERHTIQPVIHRQREQMEVRQIVQPIKEIDIEPTLVAKVEGEDLNLGTRVVPSTLHPEREVGELAEIEDTTIQYDTEVRETILPPRVEETVHKKILEQIQPVIIKEVIQPTLVEETKNIYETVVERPVITHEIRNALETPIVKIAPEMIVADLRPHPPGEHISDRPGLEFVPPRT